MRWLVPCLLALWASTAGAQNIHIDSAVEYQTMGGWEAASQAAHFSDDLSGMRASFPYFKDELFDRAVDELGINRLRLEIRSGIENPNDWFGEYTSGNIDYATWRTVRYQIVNDDSDPTSPTRSNFHFDEFDFKIENVVEPLRQRIAARGESLYGNLLYVDFDTSSFEHHNNPDEYAEFMLTVFQHMDAKFGWLPDSIEISLEPDNSSWNGTNIGQCMVAAEARLAGEGYFPDFIAPSTTKMSNSITYFDDMVAVPGAGAIVDELSYHRYGGVSDANLLAIAQRGQNYNIQTSMLEHIGSGARDLYKDLALGNCSSWQQFALAFVGVDDNGADYYEIDESDPQNPVLYLSSRAKYLRHYFAYVRRGAVRIGASSDDANFLPVAFRNADGTMTIVVNAEQAGTFTLHGLKAGEYGIQYTVGRRDFGHPQFEAVDLPDATIGSGDTLDVTIPDSGKPTTFGVATIYGRPTVPTAVGAKGWKGLR